jgi:hypothetical protein
MSEEMRYIWGQDEWDEILANHSLWAITEKECGERANFENVWLRHRNLEDKTLPMATFKGADLYYANLRLSDLRGADFSDANLEQAKFKGADVKYAKFSGARINWSSQEIISEILIQNAGSHVIRVAFAGLIILNRDLRWEDILTSKDLDIPIESEQAWAISVLKEYVQDGDGAPDALKDGGKS